MKRQQRYNRKDFLKVRGLILPVVKAYYKTYYGIYDQDSMEWNRVQNRPFRLRPVDLPQVHK